MKVTGLDGRIYGWDFTHENNLSRETSSYHEKARIVIKYLYPTDRLWEEVPLPGTRPTLFADFVLPQRRLVIEVHGQQHYEYNSFFYASKRDWAKAVQNDEYKRDWCLINNLRFVELSYKESESVWQEKILSSGRYGEVYEI